jgi:hypothetical protein
MNATANGCNGNNVQDPVHASFLAVLPRIEQVAQLAFRYVKCPQTKQDAIAETVALSWQWFGQLADRGEDAAAFPAVLAGLAAKSVRCGRRLCGQERAREVLSGVAQRRHGFSASRLHCGSTLGGNAWDEALHDNMQSPVLDQVCFRLDFPAWRLSRTERDRRVIDDLMGGERTFQVARKHGLTEGRISQLRRDFLVDWERFCAE